MTAVAHGEDGAFDTVAVAKDERIGVDDGDAHEHAKAAQTAEARLCSRHDRCVLTGRSRRGGRAQ
jgi:hypothetical protein